MAARSKMRGVAIAMAGAALAVTGWATTAGASSFSGEQAPDEGKPSQLPVETYREQAPAH